VPVGHIHHDRQHAEVERVRVVQQAQGHGHQPQGEREVPRNGERQVTETRRSYRQKHARLAHDIGGCPVASRIAAIISAGRPAAWLQIAPGQELHLVEVPDSQASPFEAEFGRHVALVLPAAKFEAIKRRLLEQGAELIESQRPTPFARFFFLDLNGYVFEVVPEERDVEVGESDAFA
jgi:hypothetical protein